jgi:hypothetical protein
MALWSSRGVDCGTCEEGKSNRFTFLVGVFRLVVLTLPITVSCCVAPEAFSNIRNNTGISNTLRSPKLPANFDRQPNVGADTEFVDVP